MKLRLANLLDLRFLLGFFITITIIVSVQKYWIGENQTFYIIKNSFFSLIHNQNIYSPQQFMGIPIDLFKYSPAFALLFAPMSVTPTVIGMVLWNLLGVILLFFAIKALPLNNPQRALVLWLILLEMLTSLQNFQSNVLISALLIFAYTSFEKQNLLIASLCIISSIYIKLFGSVALLLFLFYPGKIRFTLYCIMWSVLFFFLPLIVVSFNHLMDLYQSWWQLLIQDESVSWGVSLLGMVKNIFQSNISKIDIQLAGLIILCLPTVSTKSYKDPLFRLFYLCSIMVWVIIFNHRAESPTYIIALTGIAIWFMAKEKTPATIFVMIFSFILIALSPTDLFPKFVRTNYIQLYNLKALPAVIAWIAIQYNLFVMAIKNIREKKAS